MGDGVTAPDRYMRSREIVERSGLSRRTIARRIEAGTFPAAVKIGSNAIAWRASEFEAWFAAPMEWKAAA